MGGPIIKDRLFYFFTYDGFRKVGKALYTDSNTSSLTPSARGSALHHQLDHADRSAPYTTAATARRSITATQCNAASSS